MKTVLEVKNLNKSYKENHILNDLCMTINQGDIYGFVGKNGAGKTTLIRAISGLIEIDSGEFELFGISSKSKEIDMARKKVCTMVEAPALYLELSAPDNLKMQCYITNQDVSCVDELLNFVGLSKTGKKKAKDFSLGMRQRLGIAMALVSKPKLMLLDEPINGLDPEGIKQVRELLLKMHEEKNVTILISSHILTELSLFATRYGFIDKGKIIKEASLDEIKNEMTEGCYIEVDNIEKSQKILNELGYSCKKYGEGLKINKEIDLMAVCKKFELNKIKLTKHILNNIDLETYFMNLLGGIE